MIASLGIFRFSDFRELRLRARLECIECIEIYAASKSRRNLAAKWRNERQMLN